MAISTQNPDGFYVFAPVSEAPIPVVMPVFRPEFLRRVHMVYVQGTMIGESAQGTFPAEISDEFKFPFPVTCVLVGSVAVFVPVILLTLRLAKSRLGWLPALFTLTRVRPSVREVTGLAAKLPCAIAQTIRVHSLGLFALLTNDLNWFGSHTSKCIAYCNRSYFDIACERISAAHAQGRLK